MTTRNSVTTTNAPTEVTRRGFLAWGIGACIAFIATLLGIPAIGAVVGAALKSNKDEWISLGQADNFPEGTPTSAQFSITREDGWIKTNETKGVWVVRQGASNFTVFNGRCTHLGCAYHWDSTANEFVCPCHGGVYAKDGHVLAGPPPRSLDPLPTRVDGGNLYVQYRDFRLGIPQRVEA